MTKWTLVAVFLSIISIGCGSTPHQSPSSQSGISITPGNITLDQAATQQFTANSAVNWSVQETGGGSITNDGIYTAPSSAGTFHVLASNPADTSQSSTAAVTVRAVTVSVTPGSISLEQGAPQVFAANVGGTIDTAVDWSLQETGGGNVTSDGLYTAPVALGTFHVLATAHSDSTKSAVAVITVVPGTLAVSPSTVGLTPGQQRQFFATPNDLAQEVIWTVMEGAVGGEIDSRGVYTAPNNPGTFHVTASSIANPSQSATATIAVVEKGFHATGSMKHARTGHIATLLSDGRVLITGGIADDPFSADSSITLDTAEIYDPTTGTFSLTSGTMTMARSGHTGTLLHDGRVLIAGGASCTINGCNGTAELYDPKTDTFSSTVDMTVARTNHTATLLADGRVLIVGGISTNAGNNEAPGSAEVFDPLTGVFVRTGGLWDVDHAYGHTATLLPDDNVLIAGGETSSDLVFGNAELYTPATATFQVTGSLARYSHTATLLNDGRVLMVGGSDGNFLLASAELYESSGGTFIPTGSMAQKRWLSTANLLASGQVLVAGGKLPGACGASDECGPPTDIAEIYDPSTSTFSPAASMIKTRVGHTATSLLDGRVLITGGSTGDQYVPTSSAELYDAN